MRHKNIRCDKVIVGERYRKELGDLHGLADSIRDCGLLQPIVIDSENNLIAGSRRLKAVGILGWEKISAVVLDLDEPIYAEHDENENRKNFTASERVAIADAIKAKLQKTERRGRPKKTEVVEQPTIVDEDGREITDNTDSKNITEKIPEYSEEESGETNSIAAERAGFGNRRTYEQAKAVVENACDELVAAMDDDTVTISDAKKIANEPDEIQQRAVSLVRSEDCKTLADAIAIIKDEEGNTIPSHLADVFKMRKQFRESRRMLSAVLKHLREVMDSPARDLLAKRETSWNADIKNLNAGLKFDMPHAVCPSCSGSGKVGDTVCKWCMEKSEAFPSKGRGWLNKTTYEKAKKDGEN